VGSQYHQQKETASVAEQPEGQQGCRREKGGGWSTRQWRHTNPTISSQPCLSVNWSAREIGCCQLVRTPAAGLHDMVAYGAHFVAHMALCALFLLVVCLGECVTATPREDNDMAMTLFFVWEGEGATTLAAPHKHLPRLCWVRLTCPCLPAYLLIQNIARQLLVGERSGGRRHRAHQGAFVTLSFCPIPTVNGESVTEGKHTRYHPLPPCVGACPPPHPSCILYGHGCTRRARHSLLGLVSRLLSPSFSPRRPAGPSTPFFRCAPPPPPTSTPTPPHHHHH
jgi:hypothetical protein